MKDTREMEQDLLWVRSQIFEEADYEKLEEVEIFKLWGSGK